MGDIVSIAADQPFAAALAKGLLERFGARGLGRLRLLLPSRRACSVMQDAFLEATAGGSLLLPRLRAVADIDDELDVLDPGVDLEVPPALSPLRRQYLLFALVRRVDTHMPHEQAFRLAESLGELLDELADEDVALDDLLALEVPDAAEHWQRVVAFLRIVAAAWPAIEAQEGAISAGERRRRVLGAVAEHWRMEPPAAPVVIAGVTGSVPAVAGLIRTVLDLKEGLVVLPGCATPTELDGARRQGPTHPQWAFHRLLERLEVAPDAVATWPDAGACRSARERLLTAAFAPAQPPPPLDDLEPALADVETVEAPDQASEALAIALALRGTVERGRTALVVVPDRSLGRRVSAELARLGLQVEDSAGRPLDQTAPGVFALLAAHACLDAEPTVPWLALLKHPLARGGRDAASCRRLARRLELGLRAGVPAAPGWPSLETAAGTEPALREWFEGLATAMSPLRALGAQENASPSALLDAFEPALVALATDDAGDASELWAGVAGEALIDFLDALRRATSDAEPIAPAAFTPMLASAMAAQPVRRVETGHPSLRLLGRFEARMQTADLVVLAGLNEGAWPPAPEPGHWLGRAQRLALGLPPVEQHTGFAGHDFVQLAASAGRLLLTSSRRDATGAPAARSRFLDQLERVLRRLGPATAIPPSVALAWALTLDRPEDQPRPWARPRPTPPLDARPTRLSVSDVEGLVHNPYAVYARRVLGLRPLDPPCRPVDARERGTIVHAILDRFERQHALPWPGNALDRLLDDARAVFAEHQLGDAVTALWWPRFQRVARWLVATEPARRAGVRRVLSEQEVRGRIDLGSHEIALHGRIDRLDIKEDGQAALYDFKTGTAPKPPAVHSGERPQLPLLAALLAAAPPDEAVGAIDHLAYLELRGGEPAGAEVGLGEGVAELVAATRDGVERLLRAYADPAVPYLPVPRPAASPQPDPFAVLSRDREWLDAEAER